MNSDGDELEICALHALISHLSVDADHGHGPLGQRW